MCLYGQLVQNRKYIANKKNGGIIPAISDIRVRAVPIGCGECIECRKKEARKWQIRLLEEIRTTKTKGYFVTLTFSNEWIVRQKRQAEKKRGYKLKGYVLDNEIATISVRRYLERWRKKYTTSVRHWLITELGHEGTENIHMHGIIWTDKGIEEIRKIWKYGYVYPRPGYETKKNCVTEKTVNYIIKYVKKIDQDHKGYKSKILCSSGIGAGYLKREDSNRNRYKGKDTKETYTTRTGHEIMLNSYYRNKIYSEEEKEKLWISKLDENVRWVMGEKVDISNGEDEYYRLRDYYRAKNKKLGYGTGEHEISQKKYEEQRRIYNMQKRSGELPETREGLIPFGGYEEKASRDLVK